MSIDFTAVEKLFRVKPGKNFRLVDHNPAWAGDEHLPERMRKEQARAILDESRADLAATQELLHAADSWSVLVIFQAMDAACKDGAIKHVMSGVNPQGVEVTSFKQPSTEELDHTFLWRCMKRLPERGRIGIFNRSYDEEVLIVRVHDSLLEAQRIPGVEPRGRTWRERFDDINAFERHLARNGTAIVKIFLNISRDEQRKRFLARIDEPEKHWKFSISDVAERRHWDAYMEAYEDAIAATSTEHAPWYVIPADRKWVSRAAVATVLAGTIRRLGLAWPTVDAAKQRQIEEARRQLEKE
ncbi:MAG: polyphosphate kinase 2 family protein [Planctomycetes bacterium]|nr:polyphosphate kinase 2 family protein [Planctomycetota bacterium]